MGLLRREVAGARAATYHCLQQEGYEWMERREEWALGPSMSLAVMGMYLDCEVEHGHQASQGQQHL